MKYRRTWKCSSDFHPFSWPVFVPGRFDARGSCKHCKCFVSSRQALKSSSSLPSTGLHSPRERSRSLEEENAHQEHFEASVGGVLLGSSLYPAECSCSRLFTDLHQHPASQVLMSKGAPCCNTKQFIETVRVKS